MRSLPRYILHFCLFILVCVVLGVVDAQSRTVYWERWDVRIDNVDTVNNAFDVVEIYDVRFSGTFTFGQRVIADTNLEGIRNVRVFEAGRQKESNCSENLGTVCIQPVAEGTSVQYFFDAPITDATQSLEIHYTVEGALRSYEGGDQLWWTAVPEEHFGFTIGSSTVTVRLPSEYALRPDDPVETYGKEADIAIDGNIVTATALESIVGNERFEIRVQYPHNPEMIKAVWQDNFDTRREFEENIKPLVDIGIIVLSLVLGIVGTLGVFWLWYSRGRDPKIGVIPEYLSEPPDNTPPAVAGTLVDERAELRDIMSTLIDLARREYLVIEEERSKGLFGLGGSSEFTFKRTDKSTHDLKKFEQNLLRRIFVGSDTRSLESLKDKFYKHIPGLQNDLYDEIVDEGFFINNPNTTRSRYSVGGMVLLFGAIGLSVLLFNAVIEDFTETVLCIPAALGVTGIFLLIGGQAMPAKTLKGKEAAMKWEAFREYLRNLEKYSGVEEAADQFERYLPYAVAFGMERTWINRFKKIDSVGAPIWYYPTYRGGYYSRGYRAGTPISDNLPSAGDVLSGDLARAGGGGLDGMAGGLSSGLDSLSSGLTNMLESASRTMSSKPSSSGGGGWSGGGSGGGGSSGGGSSGFG